MNNEQKDHLLPSASLEQNGLLGDGTGDKKEKPIKAKPVFYACCYEPLKIIAKEMGYNTKK